jgi:ATP-dependent DNA helicase RecG
LDRDELKKLAALGEGQNLEFKQSLSNDLGRELCAFANTTGGRILIGVTDSGELKPLKNINTVASRIQNHAHSCEPPVSIDIEVVEGIIMVTVEPSGSKPHSSHGIFYLREGANCQKMNREQIRDFFYKEGALYFDSQINVTFDIQKDLEARHYTRFAEAAGIPADMETGNALHNIGLLKTEGLTNAGVLLLCGNAVPFFPSATVTCALFQGTTKTKILDTKIYDEDIASNYQNAPVYLKSHLNTEFIITGKRENKLELPEETHRDYRSGADVQVSIFSGRGANSCGPGEKKHSPEPASLRDPLSDASGRTCWLRYQKNPRRPGH